MIGNIGVMLSSASGSAAGNSDRQVPTGPLRQAPSARLPPARTSSGWFGGHVGTRNPERKP
jgi:hypothetical protein